MEGKFVLNELFNNFIEETPPRHFPSGSDIRTHFNTSWNISTHRILETFDFRLVSKHPNESNLWCVDVEYTFYLVQKIGDTERRKPLNPTPLRHVFNSNSHCGRALTVKMPEIIEYIVDGDLNIVCEVLILKTDGIPKERKLNFDVPIDGMSDVVLVVGYRKFYTSKLILANVSPVFNAMFFGNFQESKMTEIKIEDVKPEDFKNLLLFIYHASIEVNPSNVVRMLKLADRFDVEPLKYFCEDFLIKATRMDIQKRLKLSEEFKLCNLQNACVKSFTDGEEMREELSDISELGELSLEALLKKALTFL